MAMGGVEREGPTKVDLEIVLYGDTYLLDKHLFLRNTKPLAGILLRYIEGSIAFNQKFHLETDLAMGIIEKLGHQRLAYDYVVELHSNADTRKIRYHLANFFSITKSIFDLVAHLINHVLSLGFQGRNIDLNRTVFRNETRKKGHRLGTILNSHQSWISDVSNFRDEIEHNKVVPVVVMASGEQRPADPQIRARICFPEQPLALTEILELSERGKGTPVKEVLSFCDDSLKKSTEIVEETFDLAISKLSEH